MYGVNRSKLQDPLLATQLETLVDSLNKAKEADLVARGLTNLVGRGYDNFHVTKIGPKFIYLDAGGSGCFLVERSTGEIYNIMGYGKPDYNKHAKAPLGTVQKHALDATWLLEHRWNYLR